MIPQDARQTTALAKANRSPTHGGPNYFFRRAAQQYTRSAPAPYGGKARPATVLDLDTGDCEQYSDLLIELVEPAPENAVQWAGNEERGIHVLENLPPTNP